jgi:hypothetical protein
MARIRTLKPGFWTHEDLSALPEPTHILAAALLNYADDEGYFNANPGLVKASCSPLREPSVSIPASLQQLADIGYLDLFTGSDGKRYGRIVTFDEHQVISRPTPSKIKHLRPLMDNSVSPPEAVREDSTPEGNKEGKGKGKEKEGKSRGRAPELTLPDWLASLDGADIIREDDPIFAWAEAADIPSEWIRYAWLAFADRYDKPKNRQADWRAHFRNAVKNDWLHLWRITPQGPALTTAGETWRRNA